MVRLALGFVLMIGLAAASHAQTSQTASTVFAGGCFWCMESAYDKVDGVISTISGYAGGDEKTATYEQVSSGTTGHYEAVKIEYDPSKLSYQKLLDIFWKNIDPFDAKGQFCDKGPQYRAVIFYGSEKEKELAEASKKTVSKKLGKPVVTQILPETSFYAAEDYHQNYYQKNPIRYKLYRYGCGRGQRLEAVWGKQELSAKKR
jgi:peptide-methionine (S)-S-oxide reductase